MHENKVKYTLQNLILHLHYLIKSTSSGKLTFKKENVLNQLLLLLGITKNSLIHNNKH